MRKRCARVKRRERHETVTYFEETLGRPPGRSDDPLTEGGRWARRRRLRREVVKGIEKLWELSNGVRRPASSAPTLGQPAGDAPLVRAVAAT